MMAASLPPFRRFASIGLTTAALVAPVFARQGRIGPQGITASTDVGVTKSDGSATAVPGASTMYTINVTNLGITPVANVAVSDPLPAGVTSATWSGNGKVSISGPLNDTILSLAPLSTVVYTMTVQISESATGSLSNTVTTITAGDTNSANDSATDTDTLTPQTDAAVNKTDGTTTALIGGQTAYTINVKNNGPSTATNVAVSDPLPSGATSMIWSGNGHTNVSGNLSDTITSLDTSTTVTYTVLVQISASASGTFTNTVTVTAAGDTTPGNNSATDSDTLVPGSDISVTKADGATTATPGSSTTYTIVVTNNGPAAATNISVSDPLPAGVTSATWSGNGHVNMSGALSDTIASLASGASVTYTMTVQISASASGLLMNIVNVTAANDPIVANNSALDSDTLTATVPALPSWVFGLLAAMTLAGAAYALRRRAA